MTRQRVGACHAAAGNPTIHNAPASICAVAEKKTPGEAGSVRAIRVVQCIVGAARDEDPGGERDRQHRI